MSRPSTSGVYICATYLTKTSLRKTVACTRRAGVASRCVYTSGPPIATRSRQPRAATLVGAAACLCVGVRPS
eukprot:3622125-Pleurochrysis_carterae.AAC.1